MEPPANEEARIILIDDVSSERDKFRSSLKCCRTGEEKDRLCDDKVDSLLRDHGKATMLIGAVYDVIKDEHHGYLTSKDTVRARKWAEFDGLASEGKRTIISKEPPLRNVEKEWGKDIL